MLPGDINQSGGYFSSRWWTPHSHGEYFYDKQCKHNELLGPKWTNETSLEYDKPVFMVK
jgi:hypothetical protein